MPTSIDSPRKNSALLLYHNLGRCSKVMFIILGNYYHYLSAGWWLVLHTELKIVPCCNNAATLRKKIMMKIRRSCRKCLIFSGKCLFNIFFFLSSSQFHHCHVLVEKKSHGWGRKYQPRQLQISMRRRGNTLWKMFFDFWSNTKIFVRNKQRICFHPSNLLFLFLVIRLWTKLLAKW